MAECEYCAAKEEYDAKQKEIMSKAKAMASGMSEAAVNKAWEVRKQAEKKNKVKYGK